MPLSAQVINYRGVRTANLNFDRGVCLVGGRNRSGKSSCAEAVAAALTQKPLVVRREHGEDLHQHSAARLVHDGAEAGSCLVSGDGGAAKIVWPMCKCEVKGEKPPSAIPLTAGVARWGFGQMGLDQRLAILIDQLDATPTKDDFESAFAALRRNEAIASMLNNVWGAVQKEGWDAAEAHARSRARDLKGVFRQATGGAWGAKKGEGWRPDGWRDEWEALLGPADLEAAADAAAQALEEAIAAAGTAPAVNRETLRKTHEQLPELEADSTEAQDALGNAQTELESLREQKRLHEEVCAGAALICPHCNGLVMAERPAEGKVRLVAAEDASTPEQVDESVAAMRALAQQIFEQSEIETRLRQELGDVQAAVERAIEAGETLSELGDGAGETVDPAVQTAVIRAREAKAAADADLRAYRAWSEARECHRNIVLYDRIARELSVDGIRRVVLREKLGRFVEEINELSAIFKLVEIQIDENMAVTIGAGKRPYMLLSESEKARVNILVQVALARRRNDPLIVIDIDPELDRIDYFNLCRLLFHVKQPALVCGRFDDRGKVPVLDVAPEKAGVSGRSYWIDPETHELESLGEEAT